MASINGKIYCDNCGAEVDMYSSKCSSCGKKLNNNVTDSNHMSPKSKNIDLLLCIFLGWWGAHKLYEGKILMFILYWLTCGLCFIGWWVDIYKIATNKATDKFGRPINY